MDKIKITPMHADTQSPTAGYFVVDRNGSILTWSEELTLITAREASLCLGQRLTALWPDLLQAPGWQLPFNTLAYYPLAQLNTLTFKRSALGQNNWLIRIQTGARKLPEWFDLPLAAALISCQGELLQANPAFHQLADNIGSPALQLLPEQLPSIDALASQQDRILGSHTLRWVIFPNPPHLLGFVIDISEHSFYRHLLEHSVDGIYQTSRSGQVLYANQALLDLFGFSSLEDMQSRIHHVAQDLYINPEDRQRFVSLLEQRGLVKAFDCQMRTYNGRLIWLRQNARVIRDKHGQVEHIVGTIADISEQKQAELALRYAEEEFRSLYENAVAGLFRSSLKGYFLSVNPAMAKMLGFSSPLMCIRHYTNLAKQLYVQPDQRREMLRKLAKNQDVRQLEVEIYRVDGTPIWIQQNVRLVRNSEGKPQYIEGSAIDITTSRHAQEYIYRLAHHDSLTQLHNRLAFSQKLEQLLREYKPQQHTGFYLLMLDLDNFKDINDTQGHAFGDQLLQVIASRLQSLNPTPLQIARLGGDEFALLVPANIQSIEDFCQHLLDQIHQPLQLGGQTLMISASIGITRFPLEEHDDSSLGNLPQLLLRRADLALYRAKDAGRNGYCLFNRQLEEQTLALKQLERDLQQALQDDDQLFLVFQPLVNVHNGQLNGVEALLRWQHPELGLVSPAHFIPVAEQSGQGLALDTWVLEQACRQIQHWQERGIPLCISVNLSALQFSSMDICHQVEQLLQTYDIDPRYLALEITESMAIANPHSATRVLQELRRLKVNVILDDFGTGYSSLSYLQDLPVTKVKLDRTFIAGITQDRRQHALVASVVNLVHSLNLQLNVEGVEQETQFLTLQKLRVDEVQGFLFSKPCTAKDLEHHWLASDGWQPCALASRLGINATLSLPLSEHP
ncbi:putative bifunctional diguanylate cyclase/phosphodiesterase [Balneatrix alpica]